jgi:hypothetical protein
MKKNIFLLAAVIMFSFNSFLASAVTSKSAIDSLPKVFTMGEHEDDYEKLKQSYTSTLLSTCNGSTDLAFEKWMRLMLTMEAYAKDINYDINGIKMWIEVACEPDGTIRYISYALKPNSRFVEEKEFNGFLTSFVNKYKFSTTSQRFFINTHASFPIY